MKYLLQNREPYSLLVNDTTLLSDTSLSFRKNLFKHLYKRNHDN